MEERELVDLFDPKRVTGESQREEARWCVIVGLLCCLPEPTRRPFMSNVVRMLASCTQGTNNTGSSSRLVSARAVTR